MNRLSLISLIVAVVAVGFAVYLLIAQSGQQAGTAIGTAVTSPTSRQIVTTTPSLPSGQVVQLPKRNFSFTAKNGSAVSFGYQFAYGQAGGQVTPAIEISNIDAATLALIDQIAAVAGAKPVDSTAYIEWKNRVLREADSLIGLSIVATAYRSIFNQVSTDLLAQGASTPTQKDPLADNPNDRFAGVNQVQDDILHEIVRAAFALGE